MLKLLKKMIYQLFVRFMPDKLYLKRIFYRTFGYKLNLKNPKTFNEKLQRLKLYDRNPLYTKLVDKYESKQYIAEIIGNEYIIPTIGIYNNFNEINFDKLPNQFVIKCTHDSGTVIVVKDKCNFDKNYAIEKINKALGKNFFYWGREWPYKFVKPRIIIEKYIHDDKFNDLRDYKFYCFNGIVKLFYITSEREVKLKETFFDVRGNFLDLKQDDDENDPSIELPNNLSKMIFLAEKLSKNIPHVRVDFYEVENKIYVGELTFFDGSGFAKFKPGEWDYILGDYLTLPVKK